MSTDEKLPTPRRLPHSYLLRYLSPEVHRQAHARRPRLHAAPRLAGGEEGRKVGGRPRGQGPVRAVPPCARAAGVLQVAVSSSSK